MKEVITHNGRILAIVTEGDEQVMNMVKHGKKIIAVLKNHLLCSFVECNSFAAVELSYGGCKRIQR